MSTATANEGLILVKSQLFSAHVRGGAIFYNALVGHAHHGDDVGQSHPFEGLELVSQRAAA
ncbi:MAG: hypothetical protein FRX48_09417 [Lasallia pustulata]|uniref:Uncharacterized protein n=1 Tax=Lasallia pustulata TaxID=136370 RepID=A0A5M8PCN1_9LECA|nr:MAG: hypothetical protein FRX48_09417 [Lasallia pustulata]